MKNKIKSVYHGKLDYLNITYLNEENGKYESDCVILKDTSFFKISYLASSITSCGSRNIDTITGRFKEIRQNKYSSMLILDASKTFKEKEVIIDVNDIISIVEVEDTSSTPSLPIDGNSSPVSNGSIMVDKEPEMIDDGILKEAQILIDADEFKERLKVELSEAKNIADVTNECKYEIFSGLDFVKENMEERGSEIKKFITVQKRMDTLDDKKGTKLTFKKSDFNSQMIDTFLLLLRDNRTTNTNQELVSQLKMTNAYKDAYTKDASRTTTWLCDLKSQLFEKYPKYESKGGEV